ncbi:MAG: serine/threonine protein kinase [Myxococcota bacterium]
MARLALPVSVTQPDALPIGPGAVLDGRYQVLQRHKAGPHGLNVVALDRERSRRVVIKILVPLASGRPSDPFGLIRLTDALDKTRALQHRGSARILHSFTASVANAPSLCLVTERQSRPNLSALLNDVGAFDAYRACAIFDAVADVIESAHREGLLHLGLKPNNIFLDRVAGTSTAASVLVADLGLVDAIRQAAPAWPLHLNQRFTAPEVIDGGPVDVRADVYSLGAVLSALLGGDSHEAAPLRLMEVARRSMSNHPKNRFESVSMLREHVHDALVATVSGPAAQPEVQEDTLLPDEASRIHTPAPAPPPQNERLPKKGNRRLMWSAVALAAVAVGIVGTMVLGPPWVREYRSWAGSIGVEKLVGDTGPVRLADELAPPPQVRPVAPQGEVTIAPVPTKDAAAKTPSSTRNKSRQKSRARASEGSTTRQKRAPKADAKAEASSAPRAVTSRVKVISDPVDAVVFEDGKILGNTPLTVELTNRQARVVTVWLPGRPTQQLTINGSTKELRVALDKAPPAVVSADHAQAIP